MARYYKCLAFAVRSLPATPSAIGMLLFFPVGYVVAKNDFLFERIYILTIKKW
jgi:hypothetical protein